ncbi:unnamed protein product [Linum trigynum]|uniref:Uncharacterized protein n=1 Tax=Linum trigynum TaxID=586398 RepID=A0AAV2GMB9_9ROSI
MGRSGVLKLTIPTNSGATKSGSKRPSDVVVVPEKEVARDQRKLKGIQVDPPVSQKRQKTTELSSSAQYSPHSTSSAEPARRALLTIAEGLAVPSEYVRNPSGIATTSETRHLPGVTARCFFAAQFGISQLILTTERLLDDLGDRETRILSLEEQLKEGREGFLRELRDEILKEQEAASQVKDAELQTAREELAKAASELEQAKKAAQDAAARESQLQDRVKELESSMTQLEVQREVDIAEVRAGAVANFYESDSSRRPMRLSTRSCCVTLWPPSDTCSAESIPT